jgi:energy-coupling factor transporter ATP-binding protein EcfA2
LTVETARRKGINLHLLVCPDDPDHVARIEEKLGQLKFRYLEESFACNDDGLRRLGRVHGRDASLTDEAAVREGANQFKVDLNNLREVLADAWMRRNVVVAVAAGGTDGLAGLSADAGFHAQREELGRIAHIVFSGNPGERDYWLGKKAGFDSSGQVPKPCLHGSDAHKLDDVLQPELNRRCWMRGEPVFDTLRQALLEPEKRVYIGELPPVGPSPADTISSVSLTNAPWFENGTVKFNSGLVTVIGARGSGKTALADLLAVAAGAYEEEPGPASFVGKAKDLLDGVSVSIEWGDGSGARSNLPGDLSAAREPRVQYLSQQFVERLCEPGDLGEPLVDEIERVVFSAIAAEDRLECSSFSEMRQLLTEDAIASRHFAQGLIEAKSRVVAEETARVSALPALKLQAEDAERARETLAKSLAAVPVRATAGQVKAHEQAAARLQALREAISSQERRGQELRQVAAEVQRQIEASDAAWQSLQATHPALLDASVWSMLRLRIDTSAMAKLRQLESEAAAAASRLREKGMPSPGASSQAPALGLDGLVVECGRLAKELGLNAANAKLKLDLEGRLVAARANEDKCKKALAYAEGAHSRILQAQAERLDQYEKVFESLTAEQRALEQLYAPLRERIAEEPRLSKLGFVVSRQVDLDAWARDGEDLLDLRKPPFSRRGALEDKAKSELLQSWASGSPSEVRTAMQAFLERYGKEAAKSLKEGATPVDYGNWIFSTDHVKVTYSIEYEGVEIERLSPGTRGIVLLTLYLALDKWDMRPLVVDQPEENLDPSSVFAELVPFFREAAARRQIIMVTHNANLVVNADSDQVIVAEAQRMSAATLPQIRYTAGGLEEPAVRSDVCQLLEGGEDALRKRWQRYGVSPTRDLSTSPADAGAVVS